MTDTERSTSGEEYLSIREFAELAHVSRQAVYQRLKDLDGFTRQVDKGNGKHITLVNKRATALFDGVKSRPIDRQENSQVVAGNDKLIDILFRENERLRAELEAQREAAREQMRDSSRQIAEKDAQIAEYAARFAELATQAQQIAAQAQTLHAADKPRLIAAQGGTLEAEPGAEEEAPAPAATATAEQAEAVPQAEGAGEDKPRRGFWARLFGPD